MCNQCSNDGNPLCETCLVEERMGAEIKRLTAERDRMAVIVDATRAYVAHVGKLNSEARFRDNMDKLAALIKDGQRLWDALRAALKEEA